jgi:hypothetical protein
MFATRLYRRISDDRRKPLARYGAMESALRERLAHEMLHHQLGHDRSVRDSVEGSVSMKLDSLFWRFGVDGGLDSRISARR